MAQATTGKTTEQLLQELVSLTKQNSQAYNPYIDFLLDKRITWFPIVLEAQTAPAAITVQGQTIPSTTVIFNDTNISGFVYFIRTAANDPTFTYNLDFKIKGSDFNVPISFTLLLKDGFQRGRLARLLRYDVANKVFAAEYVPGFPGTPFNGALSIKAINQSLTAVTFDFEIIILKVTP